jgi:paraquat-inducible protein B
MHIAKTIEKVPFDAIAADLRGTLQSLDTLLGKLGRLPLDELSAGLRTTLGTLDASLHSADQLLRRFDQTLAPDLAAAVAETRRTMTSANRLLDAESPTQQDLRQSLQELTRAARSLRELADLMQRRPEVLLQGKPPDNPAAAGRP